MGKTLIYKDYTGKCLFDKNKVGKIGTNIEKETKFTPYVGSYGGIGM